MEYFFTLYAISVYMAKWRGEEAGGNPDLQDVLYRTNNSHELLSSNSANYDLVPAIHAAKRKPSKLDRETLQPNHFD